MGDPLDQYLVYDSFREALVAKSQEAPLPLTWNEWQRFCSALVESGAYDDAPTTSGDGSYTRQVKALWLDVRAEVHGDNPLRTRSRSPAVSARRSVVNRPQTLARLPEGSETDQGEESAAYESADGGEEVLTHVPTGDTDDEDEELDPVSYTHLRAHET